MIIIYHFGLARFSQLFFQGRTFSPIFDTKYYYLAGSLMKKSVVIFHALFVAKTNVTVRSHREINLKSSSGSCRTYTVTNEPWKESIRNQLKSNVTVRSHKEINFKPIVLINSAVKTLTIAKYQTIIVIKVVSCYCIKTKPPDNNFITYFSQLHMKDTLLEKAETLPKYFDLTYVSGQLHLWHQNDGLRLEFRCTPPSFLPDRRHMHEVTLIDLEQIMYMTAGTIIFVPLLAKISQLTQDEHEIKPKKKPRNIYTELQ